MEERSLFSELGEDLFQIANKIMENEKLCKLLHYTDKDVLTQPPVEDTFDLLHKNIRIVPQLTVGNKELGSYIVVTLGNFNPTNNYSYMRSFVNFEIVTPIDKWLINDKSLRPFLIMQELHNMFDKSKLTGIGDIQFVEGDILILTPEMIGYTMSFSSYNTR